MNIENRIYNAKKSLDLCRDNIESRDYDTALAVAASVYSDVRWLMEIIYKMKRSVVLAARPPGEDSRKEKGKCQAHRKP